MPEGEAIGANATSSCAQDGESGEMGWGGGGMLAAFPAPFIRGGQVLGGLGTDQTLVRAARAFRGHMAGSHLGSGIHHDDFSRPERELASATAASCSCAGSAGAWGLSGEWSRYVAAERRAGPAYRGRRSVLVGGEMLGGRWVSPERPSCKYPGTLRARRPSPSTRRPLPLHLSSESPPRSWCPATFSHHPPGPCSGTVASHLPSKPSPPPPASVRLLLLVCGLRHRDQHLGLVTFGLELRLGFAPTLLLPSGVNLGKTLGPLNLSLLTNQMG